MVTTPDFTIDFAAKRVLRDGEAVRLTPDQWRIVEVLVRHPGRWSRYAELLHDVWGPGYGTETNYLRVFMTHIRERSSPSPPSLDTSSPSPGWAKVSGRRLLPADTRLSGLSRR